MKLGVDVFSIRSQGWNVFEYLDYCKKIDLDLVHFSDLEPFESTEDSYIKEVRTYADDLGLALEAGMGSICPLSTMFDPAKGEAVDQVKQMLHIAHLMGSPTLRCFLGSQADRQKQADPLEAHRQATLETCYAVKDLALALGIKLEIENHAGDMQGWELKRLIEQAGLDYVGACIDSGNPLWVIEDPMVTLEQLAPYIVTCHIRDTAVWPHPKGAAAQWVVMGEGNVGIKAWVEALHRHHPQLPLTVEIITGMAPRVLNYLEDDFWSIFPQAKAVEFARFERLIRQGTAFTGTMVTAPWRGDIPAEYQAALTVQQRLDLERSVTYCRETFGKLAK